MRMDWPPSSKVKQPKENRLPGQFERCLSSKMPASPAFSGIALIKTGHNIAHTVRALPRAIAANPVIEAAE
jgi:hypothetical protein